MSDVDSGLSEQFHRLRRALNGVVLQAEVAKMVRTDPGALDKALSSIASEARKAAELTDDIQSEVSR